ncbi:hypothetical protein FRC02_010651 [Tulasnella sp. 418]|nr:hypothetical protein FRC02_010651 [Tulasnella sp. 418]
MSSDRDNRRCEDYRREYAPHDRTSRDRKGKARATDYRDGSVRGGGSRRSGFGSRHDSESRRERSSTSRRPSPSLGSPRRRGTEIEASEIKNSATSAYDEPSTRREVQEQSEMDPPAVIDLITVGSSNSSRMQVDPSPDNQSETLPLEGSSKQLAGGISIKGASLTATKSSGGLTIKGRATVKAENSNPDALEANHGPSLLARMSDPPAITQEISERLGQRPTPSPTISEAMDETRAELIARRKGEVREIGRTQRLDATGSGLNVSPLIEDDQQRQLLQKLEAEKLTQLNAANDSSSDSQSQKEAQLRTQLRLRLRLAAEKRRTDEMETPQQYESH